MVKKFVYFFGYTLYRGGGIAKKMHKIMSIFF